MIMNFLTNEKLTIVGAAGMIGSNMAQTAMMMKLTPNICLYDPYAPALEGVAEELLHCGFADVNLTFTSDIKEALTGASYIVSSGGAARKAGMTREDLLKGNCRSIRQRYPPILSGSETCGSYIQPGRHNGTDYFTLFRAETFTSIYTGSIGQYSPAKRTGEIL